MGASGCSLLFGSSPASSEADAAIADAAPAPDAVMDIPCSPETVDQDCPGRQDGREVTCHCGLCAHQDLECDASGLRYASGACVGVPVEIDAYYKHTCALRSDGTVFCWGFDSRGQLGDQPDLGGAVEPRRPAPVPVRKEEDGELLRDVRQVVTGIFHTCALLADGRVNCWGYSWHGQIGNGSIGEEAHALEPDRVELGEGGPLEDVESLASGGQHTCAVLETNEVACWGLNNHGQLGDAELEDRPAAVPLSGIEVLHLAAGGEHTCAVTLENALVCWGRDNHGQIGDGLDAALEDKPEPMEVVTLADGKPLAAGRAAAGNWFGCAGTGEPSLYCWGWNNKLALGTDDVAEDLQAHAATPVLLSLGDVALDLDGGSHFACALKKNGSVACWGQNDLGQLGRGEVSTDPVYELPGSVPGLSGVRDIAVGWEHVCALTSDHEVFCWGRNDYGQLGVGDENDRLAPTKVLPMCP